MSVAELSTPGVHYRDSPLESRRFGLPVGRLTVAGTDATPGWQHQVADVLDGCGAEVVVTRWPAREAAVAATLAAQGRRVIPADNLVYWEVPTAALVERYADPGEACRTGALDAAQLDALVLDTFADYPSHYSANPLFPADLALAGYREWAEHSRSSSPDLVVSLHEGREPIGVATCAVDGDLDILLAGIASAHQGRGHYARLLAGVARLASDLDVPRIVISTQAGNVNVQRAWARAGFVPFAAFATAHLVRQDP
ncbi:GNAT family N-acetyltransferase [Nocardioides zeicaulis]|uniref:GNAT family N-acetyltransferase n=1 Tax=Nocardioides zeicaulis TaxID=1776857 RepID=A0ABV6DXW9_9ACTN